MAFPESRPAGSSCGVTPPTVQRSPLRGLNGTVTRSPATNRVLSAACSIACSYWTVGPGGRVSAGPGVERGGDAVTADGSAATRRPTPAASASSFDGTRRREAACGTSGAGGRGVLIDRAVLERVSGDVETALGGRPGLSVDGPGAG